MNNNRFTVLTIVLILSLFVIYGVAEEDDGNAQREEEEDVNDDNANANTNTNTQYFNDDGSINFSKFSIKFQSCSSLNMDAFNVEDFTQYNYNNKADNDDNDDNNDNDGENENDQNDVSNYQYPYNTAQIVSYRLCPIDSCKDNSWNGCRRTAGNYMISLEDYVEMHQEDVNERIEQYCDYCDQCKYLKKTFNYKCGYYNDCYNYNYNYTSMCDGGDNAGMDYSQYLECTEVEVINEYNAYNADDDGDVDDYLDDGNRRLDNGNEKVYVKIYCDGSIKLGMFSDDSCSNYIGDSSAVYTTTGIKGVEDDLNYGVTNKRCLSCSKKKSKYVTIDFNGYQNQDDGDDNGDDADEVFEVCENLYDNSLQCNSHLDNNHNYQKDVATCNLIDSFQKGHIDASGNILTKMTAMDWLVLLFIIPGCIAMVLVIAFFIYTSRTNNTIENEDLDDNLVPTVRFSDDQPAVIT